jgi:starch synthase (maltosyl-transferring)
MTSVGYALRKAIRAVKNRSGLTRGVKTSRQMTVDPQHNNNMERNQGRRRVVIEAVCPELDGGVFAIKRVPGELVVVEADIFADGHDALSCILLYRTHHESDWSEARMESLGNDRRRGQFRVSAEGRYFYTLEAWVDHFRTWRKDLVKRIEAGQDVRVEILIGAQLIEEAARIAGPDSRRLMDWAAALRKTDNGTRCSLALDEELAALIDRYPNRERATRYGKELPVHVDRRKARFSTWYEMFPRSCVSEPGRHGNFRDCESRLEYVAAMGFDVVYLPPIHPIGSTYRKGKNNKPEAGPEDVGSPWAIGSADGGHKSVHPQLGTLNDFDRLVRRASELGLEVALDLAFQCTPDHPYVTEHPEWFRRRPDGTIQYAENPPKKYQDIYPLDFESKHWEELWDELRSVVVFWIERGVRIFRVDNPHTKAFNFWQWMIGDLQSRYTGLIFLAEAFTRPKVMHRLAKLGFTQSYTYFTWRNTKHEITDYFTTLTQTEIREFFRPNLWPNTPDILHEYLQTGGRPAFMIRVALAATLGANYGIYGPAFELCENTPREPGSEEYLNSEKYEIRPRNPDSEWSLREYIAQLNRIRHENPALQSDWGLRFHEVDNPMLVCYSKMSDDRSNVIIVVVNLDFHHTQSGWTQLDLEHLGIDSEQPYQVHDVLGGGRYLWLGSRNYVELNPLILPAHVLCVRQKIRTEMDFDYYL